MLRLTPNERGVMTAAEWVETVGRVNLARGRTVKAVRCGDFSGNAVQIEAGDEWIRGWALCSDATPLDAHYRCLAINSGRDDAAVDEMLNTLRVDATGDPSPQSP
jgi:hypothetical protein